MAGPTYGASGLQIQTATEVQSDLAAYLQTQFGVSLQALNGNAVVGELVSALAQILVAHQEGIDGVYQSFHLDAAAGVNLDRLVQLVGITRNAATRTVVTVTLTNSDGVAHTAPLGAVVQHIPTGQLFGVTAATLVGAGGTADVQVQASATGPIDVTVGTAADWAWVTSYAGSTFIAVSNAAAGTPGTAEESDADLRVRTLASAHLPGKGNVDSIRAGIADINGVTYCEVFENVSNFMGIVSPVTIPLLPAHSFVAVVVAPDTAAERQAIAQVVFDQKPAGIDTYGNKTESITDSQGYAHNVKFELATASTIVVTVQVVGVSTAFDTAIKDAIVSYIGGTLSTGDTVTGLNVGGTIVADALRCAIFDATLVNGKSTCTAINNLKFDTSPVPINTGNFTLPWNQYPITNGANITVTH